VPFGIENHLLGEPWREFVLPLMLREFRAKVFHDPAYFLPGAGSGAKRVVTIHDLTPFRFPESNSRKFNVFMRGMTRLSLRRADLVLTDTEFIRQEILERFSISEERVAVVSLGVDPFPAFVGDDVEFLRAMEIRKPYFFSNALMEPRKNVETFLKAAILLAEEPSAQDFHVVLGGERGWKTDAMEALAEHPALRPRLVFTGYVDRATQGCLYSNASAYVLPSLYEGFGLPALEALAVGCPLIASDIPPLREIAGDCAAYFPATDERALAGLMAQSLGGHLPNLREAGLERAKLWSWENSVRDYVRVMTERIG
jgi:alpha-1,3-rhamnosyl/mannosyltransferase